MLRMLLGISPSCSHFILFPKQEENELKTMFLAMSPRNPGGWFCCCWLLLGGFSRSGWEEHSRDQHWSRALWDMNHVAIPLNPAVLPGYLRQCELPKDILVEYKELLSNKELEFLFHSFYMSSWHFPLPILRGCWFNKYSQCKSWELCFIRWEFWDFKPRRQHLKWA